jgi:hypothetical protein
MPAFIVARSPATSCPSFTGGRHAYHPKLILGIKTAKSTTSIDTFPTRPSPTFHAFLVLPLELREKIYTHYLTPGPIIVSSHKPTFSTPKFLPSLAYTSRAQRHEVSRVLLRRAPSIVLLDADATSLFTSFLSSLTCADWDPFALVQELEYVDASHFSAMLLKQCLNVRSLELGFPDTMGLLDEVALKNVSQCQSLRRVRLIYWTSQGRELGRIGLSNARRHDELTALRLRELGVAMKEGFEQDVVVSLVARKKNMMGCDKDGAEEVL